MPQINKQSPAPKRNGEGQDTAWRRPTASGSVLAGAIDVTELADLYIKMVIYGQNRVGKTTLACKFPKPLLLVSFEPAKTGGAKSVKRVEGVKYLRITSSKQALQLAQELKSDRYFKTHVLDTATSYQDLILQEILDLPAVPEQLNWGMVSQDEYRQRSEKTKEALRPFLNLDCNTVILAKERDHNPPKEERNKLLRSKDDMRVESYFASDLGSATVSWLHDACDYIGRLYLAREIRTIIKKAKVAGKEVEHKEEVETGKIVRRLRTLYHPNYAAGFRSENPEKVPEFIEDPSYEKILAIIQAK